MDLDTFLTLACLVPLIPLGAFLKIAQTKGWGK